MEKTQRIRDYIHKLIVFDKDDDTDCIAWDLINTREFQRLRRIRQLGFSEFVFPGATHTRFSHCIGVFHTARQLLKVLKRKSEKPYDLDRARVAAIAALLHDIGHGPFSHVFENVKDGSGGKISHEEWSAKILRGDTEVHAVLDKSVLADQVAAMILEEEPRDIYSTIVSSQFDADRLDYLRRDQYMTGTGLGHFDYDWLIDSLEVGKVLRETEGEDPVEVSVFFLNHKGLQAAEGYLLARFQMYHQVYMHKTTRGAEQLLREVLSRVAKATRDHRLAECGLSPKHALARFWQDSARTLGPYLRLDDYQVWSGLEEMQHARDEFISQVSRRILNRKLYKCFDAGEKAWRFEGDFLLRFQQKLLEAGADLRVGETVFVDDGPPISAYKAYGWDENVLENVLIARQDRPRKPDIIKSVSQLVKSLAPVKLFRVYVQEASLLERLDGLFHEVAK
jgi:hypothetical protein